MRETALQVVCVAVLLVTAGCAGLPGGGGDSDGGGTTAADVRSSAVDAMSDVETYRMEMEMNISANGQTLTMRQQGVFDHADERARMNVSMMGQQTTTYVDGTTLYTKAAGRWRTQNLSGSGLWENGTSADRQRQILQSGNVTIQGSATVNGTETTVLHVEADTEELKALIQQQQGGQAMSGVGIENATYTVYVANETSLVRKVELSMTMTINGQSADANATITFSEYGEPVDVTIPDAATSQTERVAAVDATVRAQTARATA
ncbi:MAG: DUF6612 family protein [Halobacterium sp.]